MTKKMESAGFDDKVIKRQIAIIQSMTKKERKKPDLMQASRKKRVAAGAGLEVSEVNKLLKMHRQMADMMKKMGKMGKKGMMRGALSQMFGKGGMPPGAVGGPGGGLGGGLGAGAAPGGLPPGFPGLGGAGGGLQLPPGLGGLGKKK
jgi:signal recognition particle subunit SRP54